MSSKYIKKHPIPDGFEELLTEFTKEILRNQPLDIIDFSCEYFRCLQESLLLDYEKRGQNIPCDFKPIIPKFSKYNPVQGPIVTPFVPKDEEKKDEKKKEEDEKKDEKNLPMESEEPKPSEKEDDKNLPVEDDKNLPVEGEEKEKEEEKNVETLPEKTEEENNLPAENEEDKNKNVETLPEKKEEENEDYDPSGNIKANPIEVGETPEDEEKDKVSNVLPSSQRNIDENKNLISTKSNYNEINEETPAQTLTNFDKTNYLNCIDFEEKENTLNSLKETDPLVPNYIESTFEPYKDMNDLLILIQKGIMSFYNTKGTENEEEFNQLNEEIKNKISELSQTEKGSFLNEDLTSQEDINEAIKIFKSKEYYPRITKCYMMKLDDISKENDPILDEFSFFLFDEKIKLILENEPNQILNQKPYLMPYFEHNIELLQPEIYSFVLNSIRYTDDEFCSKFTQFSIRKRELCLNFYNLYNLNNKESIIIKQQGLLEKCHYISSPHQIKNKLDEVNEENKEGIYNTVQEKLQENYSKMWGYIQRVINTPIELVDTSFYDYSKYETIEREIISKWLDLNDDYKDISEKLKNINIDGKESNFSHKLNELYIELENCPKLSYRNNCIFRNKYFEVPESCQSIIEKIDDQNNPINEEELFQEFKEKSPLAQDGIYYYLLIKNKDLKKYDDLLLKITQEKEKREIESLKSRGNALKENFTDDSDEFVAYKNDYIIWKQNVIPTINKWFETEDQLKDNYFTNELNYENEKQILIRMLECEYLLDDNSPFRFKIPKYKNIIGDASPTKEIKDYVPSEDNGVVEEKQLKETSEALPPSEINNEIEAQGSEEHKEKEEEDKKDDITPGQEDIQPEEKKEDVTPGQEDIQPEEVEDKEIEDKKEEITPGQEDIQQEEKKEDITPGVEDIQQEEVEDKKEDVTPGQEDIKQEEVEDKKEEDIKQEEVEDKKEDITPGQEDIKPEGDNSNLPQEEAQYMDQEEQEKKEQENEHKEEEMYIDNEEKPEQKVDENNNDLPREEEKKEENLQSEEGTNENISEKNETKYTGNFY